MKYFFVFSLYLISVYSELPKIEEISQQLQKARTFVGFIGTPRSSSTLVGQIINSHPRALISNENMTVSKFLKKSPEEWSKSNLIKYISSRARRTNDWVSNPLPIGGYLVCGDKGAGSTTRGMINYPDRSNEFTIWLNKLGYEVAWVFIIRNPFDNIASWFNLFHKSGINRRTLYANPELLTGDRREIFLKIIKEYFKHLEKATEKYMSINFVRPYHLDERCFLLYHEDLVNSPNKKIDELFKFIHLDVRESFTNQVASRVRKSTNPSRDWFVWPATFVELIESEMKKNPLLHRYLDREKYYPSHTQ